MWSRVMSSCAQIPSSPQVSRKCETTHIRSPIIVTNKNCFRFLARLHSNRTERARFRWHCYPWKIAVYISVTQCFFFYLRRSFAVGFRGSFAPLGCTEFYAVTCFIQHVSNYFYWFKLYECCHLFCQNCHLTLSFTLIFSASSIR